jgi:hypothetical protein
MTACSSCGRHPVSMNSWKFDHRRGRVSSAKSLLPRYYVEPAHLEDSCFGRLHRPKAVFITTNADEADTPRLACALRRWLEECDVDPDPLAPALW